MAAAAPPPAQWKPLLLAALRSNAHLKHSAFLQLATVGADGRPANRTVVFRGFHDDSDKIHINTDARTSKIEEIKHCPYGEICWYFTDSREQFRINGGINIIDASSQDPVKLQQREKAWFASSPKSRFQYLGPPPRLPYVSEESHNTFQIDMSTGPVNAFCLLVLDPEQVDYVNLKSNERMIFTSRISGDGYRVWKSAKVNP